MAGNTLDGTLSTLLGHAPYGQFMMETHANCTQEPGARIIPWSSFAPLCVYCSFSCFGVLSDGPFHTQHTDILAFAALWSLAGAAPVCGRLSNFCVINPVITNIKDFGTTSQCPLTTWHQASEKTPVLLSRIM